MDELFGDVNIPPIIIDMGMHAIQPGVRYNNMHGFFRRAFHREAVSEPACAAISKKMPDTFSWSAKSCLQSISIW